MKKLIALALAALLSLSFCAFATEVPEFEAPDIKPSASITLPEFNTDAMAASTNDIVTVDGNTTVVNTGKVAYTYTQDPNLPYFCFTQDLRASFDSYMMLNDMTSFQTTMVNMGAHLLFINNNASYYFYLINKDSPISGTVDASLADLYAVKLMLEGGYSESDIETIECANGMRWAVAEHTIYATFAGDQLIIAYLIADGDVTADDLLDVQDLLSCITVA